MKRRGALALMALGILLAGGASVLVLGIARQASEASRAVIPQVYVVMAAREIPDQTQVTPDALVIRPFPADFAPVGAIANPDQAVGKFAMGTIYKDQIILAGHVSTAQQVAEHVRPGARRTGRRLAADAGVDRRSGRVPARRPAGHPALAAARGTDGPGADDAPANASSGKQSMSTQTTLQNVEIFALGERPRGRRLRPGRLASPARRGTGSPAARPPSRPPGRDHHQVHQGLGRHHRPGAALVGRGQDRSDRRRHGRQHRRAVPLPGPAWRSSDEQPRQSARLRVLVLRDPGFQMDDQENGSRRRHARCSKPMPSFRVTEGAAGYGEAARAVQRTDVDIVTGRRGGG